MASVHPTVEQTVTPGFVATVGSPIVLPASCRWFPSYRLLTAIMLCLCFACIHLMNSNMSMAVICMCNNTEVDNGTLAIGSAYDPNAEPQVNWTAEEQGYIFGAFNAGLLCMLITGFLADKFNAKYMIIVSVLLASFANFMIPLTAHWSANYVIAARFLVGLADSLTQPALNSLLTRWFPSSERSYALSISTGGRQVGTLLIIPTAGALCSQTDLFGGWPSIFYLSGLTGILFVAVYLFIGADKPSKQSCISDEELRFITLSNSCEDFGKKRTEREVPWIAILKSGPVWAALISVVCHEFPLMTIIMFLPSYLHDVHHYDATKNGIASAVPTACLLFSKLGCSYLNTWLQERTSWDSSKISKVLNGVGSLGLALFMVAATFLDETRAPLAVVFLSLSMIFTGMHTSGCLAALIDIAPAFAGAITGLTFFFVAISGIINPAMTKWIVRTNSAAEWNLVFYISTVIALIPVVVFTLWGSAEVQDWARSPTQNAPAKPIKKAPIESQMA
ncbi:MFS domain-containing protein [Aphelenchoides bicaudatus]|nr:MFS domain-containing protein [Aphelenchoides bicaudatus]